jgi:hypothetical protein
MDKARYSNLSDEEVVRELNLRVKRLKELLREVRDLLKSVGG